MSVDLDTSGYVWRKYGEKTVGVRKQAVKRSYYRCVGANTHSPCSAKKRVDHLAAAGPSDPPLSISFVNKHNHRPRREGHVFGDAEEADWSLEEEEAASDLGQGLERMRAEDLAREMYSDLMFQMQEEREGRAIPDLSTPDDLLGDRAVPSADGASLAAGCSPANEAEELLRLLLEANSHGQQKDHRVGVPEPHRSSILIPDSECAVESSTTRALDQLLEALTRDEQSSCAPPAVQGRQVCAWGPESIPALDFKDGRMDGWQMGQARVGGGLGELEHGRRSHGNAATAMDAFSYDDLVCILKQELIARTQACSRSNPLVY